MYVAELDRPWTDTPFVFQGFHLRTDQQLQALKKFCKYVFVDVQKTELEDRSRRPALPGLKTRGNTAYPETVSVETEVQRAAPVYTQTVAAVNELLRPLAQGSTVLEGREVKDSVTRLTDSVVRNPDALLLVSKLREKSAAAHARALQVSIYMIVFARFLELAREELELLGLLGLLQDVGKTQLPASIMEKQGPLTPEQAEFAKKHVALSAEILKATPGLPSRLPELALLHHERQDGSGYPRGLKGEQIGLYGSIAAIADILDLDKDPKVRPDEPYRIRRTMEQSKLEVDPRELFL